MLRLRFGDLLRERGLTAYQVVRASRLPRSTVYGLASARADRVRVDLDVLSEAMSAVERLSGEPVTITDVLATGVDEACTETATPDGAFEEVPLPPGHPGHWRSLVGAFDDPSSPGDVSARHDYYLALAIEEELRDAQAESERDTPHVL